MLHGSAQLQLNPPPGGDAEVAKQPGDVAQGSGGDALSLLQASVPGADSSSDDAAKTRSSEPRGAALRDLPQPWLLAPGSHSHKQRMNPLLGHAAGVRMEEAARSGFIISVSNTLLGRT